MRWKMLAAWQRPCERWKIQQKQLWNNSDSHLPCTQDTLWIPKMAMELFTMFHPKRVCVSYIYIHTHVTCICICICVYQRLLSFGYLKSSTRAYTGVPAASQQLVKRVYPKKEVSCSAFHIASLGVGIQVQVRNSNQVHNKNQHGGHPVTPSKAIRNCRTGQERHSTFVYTKWATGKKVQLFHIYSIWVERWPVKHP